MTMFHVITVLHEARQLVREFVCAFVGHERGGHTYGKPVVENFPGHFRCWRCGATCPL